MIASLLCGDTNCRVLVWSSLLMRWSLFCFFSCCSLFRRGALDIFSQFFTSPLLSESSTDRELLAVDSEDSKNRTNDDRRILQVISSQNFSTSFCCSGQLRHCQ